MHISARRSEVRRMRTRVKTEQSRAKKHNGSNRSVLVAIVGGSGSGKSWFADALARALGKEAARISLDDFYRDRSHLSTARRALINFDHPKSIDWDGFETVLKTLARGTTAEAPCYDFATHCRTKQTRLISPKPFLIFDGLWLLRRPRIRKMFRHRIFLDRPARIRLHRRLRRDLQARGRTQASIRQQFRTMVEPMHRRFVAPQREFATVILAGECGRSDVSQIVCLLRAADYRPKATRYRCNRVVSSLRSSWR